MIGVSGLPPSGFGPGPGGCGSWWNREIDTTHRWCCLTAAALCVVQNAGSVEDKVIDSRPVNHFAAIRRRRICLKCNFRFTTYEEIERIAMRLVKRDGRHEPFDRNKLLSGMVAACQKRPVALDALEKAGRRDYPGDREHQRIARSLPGSWGSRRWRNSTSSMRLRTSAMPPFTVALRRSASLSMKLSSSRKNRACRAPSPTFSIRPRR